MKRWTTKDIPDQSGRTAVVTGANSGIGYITARELARRGARVVLACRDETRGREAEARLRRAVPGGQARFARLDLADLASVRDFARRYEETAEERGDGGRLDLLVNNAGVMALPHRLTVDGFEMQFGVNHLGHFALTGLLMPRLLATAGARVISVSSGMHAMANVDLHDPNSERRYRRWLAYARSKSANLLFVHELARKLAQQGADVVAAAAHPGYAATNLQTTGSRMEGRRAAERAMLLSNRLLAQSAEAGAMPTLYAATAPGVAPDSFTGPRLLGWRGSPAPSRSAPWTKDDRAGMRLWELSEQLTGVRY
ncbi:oxidoreductase [Streptomyces sp. TP-A0874]|uniref:oxidoreductase n=1 Tax=Streptomyces sp. TP-A0874 TaxID=549819 RepID=UPI000852D05B|nr:oxidoreductase [Streptomyces sp. TP-A0874]